MINIEKVVGKTQILGRPFNGRTLTVDDLHRLKLIPIQEFTIKERTIYLSDIFKTPARRLGCIAYVQKDDTYSAHTFFLSRSQGVWRLVRRYRFEITEDGREKPNWHDKGFGEESLFAPYPTQNALKVSNPILDIGEEAELVYFGTCVSIQDKDQYEEVISKEPILLKGNFYSDQKKVKIAPEELLFNNTDDEPDFSIVRGSWKTDLPLYGAATVRAFWSKDERLCYLFNQTDKGRIWVSGIDNRSALTELGIREQWVKAGDLTTPPWEYLMDFDEETGVYMTDQTGGYGDVENRHKSYVDMWKNYLSKIPIIIEYSEKFK